MYPPSDVPTRWIWKLPSFFFVVHYLLGLEKGKEFFQSFQTLWIWGVRWQVELKLSVWNVGCRIQKWVGSLLDTKIETDCKSTLLSQWHHGARKQGQRLLVPIDNRATQGWFGRQPPFAVLPNLWIFENCQQHTPSRGEFSFSVFSPMTTFRLDAPIAENSSYLLNRLVNAEDKIDVVKELQSRLKEIQSTQTWVHSSEVDQRPSSLLG